MIQLVEIQSQSVNCSIYGDGINLIKDHTKTASITDFNRLLNSYKVEPYFNHRIKVTLYMPQGMLIAITEPFQHIFTESETCKDCIAMELEDDNFADHVFNIIGSFEISPSSIANRYPKNR